MTLADAYTAYLFATALVTTLGQEVEDLFPAPPADCSEERFDRWNDATEDALSARGYYAAVNQRRAAEDALLRAARERLAAFADLGEASIAFDAALGEGRRFNYTARVRLVELACRYAAAKEAA